MASCSRAHERLQRKEMVSRAETAYDSRTRIAYKDAYMPATHISNWISPGWSEDEDVATGAAGLFALPLETACFSELPLAGLAIGIGVSGGSSITPEDGTRCRGAACFLRAIWRSRWDEVSKRLRGILKWTRRDKRKERECHKVCEKKDNRDFRLVFFYN